MLNNKRRSIMKSKPIIGILIAVATMVAVAAAFFGLSPDDSALAQQDDEDNGNAAACNNLPSYEVLTDVLENIVVTDPADNSANAGLNNDMWATIVNRDGIVCAVTFSGDDRGDQWPGSRVISAQKANTANSFSLPAGAGGLFDGLALSTANLWATVQPGGSLFGLQFSNPVDPAVAYRGNPMNYGQSNDPMVGRKIGGVNVFGGGLGLYDEAGNLLGGLGLSGDTSCTDHIIAWKVRNALGLDHVPSGVSPAGDDNIIFDTSASFGHPHCLFLTKMPPVSLRASLTYVIPIS
jgi:uncharacterized protein GlcG (DUF336 family)